MAIAYERALGSNSGGSIKTITTTAGASVGETVILYYVGINTITAVSDTAGNTWAVDALSGATISAIAHTHVTNAISSGDTITITSAGTIVNIYAGVFSGLDTTQGPDQTGTAMANSTATQVTLATTTANDELIVAALGANANVRFTPLTNYTELYDANKASGLNYSMEAQYRIVSSTGAYTPGGTRASSGPWGIGAATFKMATGGGGTDATGTVSDQTIPVAGSSITGTAGTSATGTVAAQALKVARSMASASDGTYTETTLWSADHEENGFDDWYYPETSATGAYGGGQFDNDSAVTTIQSTVAHTGTYAARMRTLDFGTVPEDGDGCRLFRWDEPRVNREAYYEAYYYLADSYNPDYGAKGYWFWQIMQFKSRNQAATLNDPFWILSLWEPSEGHVQAYLTWWGNMSPATGPHFDESGFRNYAQSVPIDVPIATWVRFRIYLKQNTAGNFDGQITLWQDDTLLLDITDVRTGYDNNTWNDWEVSNEWAVTNYNNGLTPNPSDVYVDDARIFTLGAPSGVDATGTVAADTIPVTGSSITGTAGALGTVALDTVPVAGSSISATAGQSDTGTVAAQTIAVAGSSITATTGTGATGTVSAQSVPASGSSITGTANALGTVSAQTIPAAGSSITATAGTSATGTVSAQTVPATGSSITGTADANATVSAQTVPVTGSSITGSAGSVINVTGTVASQTVPVSGSSITGTAQQNITGTVAAQTIPVTGSTITGTAGTVIDATGTVAAQSVPVAGSSITATAGQGETGTVAAQTIPATGSAITATAGQSATGTVAGSTVTVTGSAATASADVYAQVLMQSIGVTGSEIVGTVGVSVDFTLPHLTGTITQTTTQGSIQQPTIGGSIATTTIEGNIS